MNHAPKRRQGETSHAYSRLCQYLELGPKRSLAKLCASLGKKSGYERYLEVMSSANSWVARAREYDEAVAAERLAVLSAAQMRAVASIAEQAEGLIGTLLLIAAGRSEAGRGQVESIKLALALIGLTPTTQLAIESVGPSDAGVDVDSLSDAEIDEAIKRRIGL